MQLRVPFAISLLAATLTATTARAADLPLSYDALPDPTIHKHDRFYLNYALGGGYTTGRVEATPEPADAGVSRVTGGAVASHLLIGGTPAPGLVVGGGTVGTVLPKASLKRDGEKMFSEVLNLGSLGVFVTYYPNPRQGLHFMGHLGVAGMDYDRDDVDNPKSAIGYSATGGIGYDWWIGEQWSLGLFGRFQYARTKVKLEIEDGTETTFVYKPLSPALLLSVTYH
jgi:hypothetical protein